MKLIIASNNKHKIYEIKTILAEKFDEILSLSEAGIAHETVEDGTTFMENAMKKAREIAEISLWKMVWRILAILFEAVHVHRQFE